MKHDTRKSHSVHAIATEYAVACSALSKSADRVAVDPMPWPRPSHAKP